MSTAGKIIGTTAGVIGGGIAGQFLAVAIAIGAIGFTAQECSTDLIDQTNDAREEATECMQSGLNTWFITAAAGLFLPVAGAGAGGVVGYKIGSGRNENNNLQI